jgi:hypothetical protein
MFTTTRWRATAIAKARYTEVPEAGTPEMDRWLFTQHAGRAFLSHVWDCPRCNPNRMPPETLKSRACAHGEALFGDFLRFAEAIEQTALKPLKTNRIRKAMDMREEGGEDTNRGPHILALLVHQEPPKRFI